jgi:threonine synthase
LGIATNANDILVRFFESGVYERQGVHATVSPAMDIGVSSNFERYLFHLCGDDAVMVAGWMQDLRTTGRFTLSAELLDMARRDFFAQRVRVICQRALLTLQLDDSGILEVMASVFKDEKYTLDPHTAIGVHVAMQSPAPVATVALATAHPVKFLGAVYDALQPGEEDVEVRVLRAGKSPVCPIPEIFHGLMDRPRRCDRMEYDLDALKRLISLKCAHQ